MKSIGLALGGGAVLGAAHIGVLKAIREKNISVEYLTGTSIGAFVAALYAFGKTWEEIQAIALELKWMDITDLSLSRYGLLSNEKMGELITGHIGNQNIEDADIPLAMLATNISNGDKVVLDKGPVAEAVMASTCIPGIFNPVKIEDVTLVDGGIVENVPIHTVREMGASYIIAVDLNAKHEYGHPDNILDVILNSFHFIMGQTVKLQSEAADLLIQPDLSPFNRSNMDQVEDLMKQGYDDAVECLKDLRN
jgi:NTE family protein